MMVTPFGSRIGSGIVNAHHVNGRVSWVIVPEESLDVQQPVPDRQTQIVMKVVLAPPEPHRRNRRRQCGTGKHQGRTSWLGKLTADFANDLDTAGLYPMGPEEFFSGLLSTTVDAAGHVGGNRPPFRQ